MEKKISEDFIIRSPEEEYTNYVQQQIDLAIRFEEREKVALYQEALELGLKTLTSLKKSQG